jgi:hypothetical protein
MVFGGPAGLIDAYMGVVVGDHDAVDPRIDVCPYPTL